MNECKPLPSSAGTAVSWFPPRRNIVNAVNPPSVAGTLVSWFPQRFKGLHSSTSQLNLKRL